MSEHLLRILLTELRTFRVRCRHCAAVFEVDLDRLDKVLLSGDCPFCSNPILPAAGVSSSPSPLGQMARAVRTLRQLKDVEVEVVLPATMPPASP